jgi:hypothetical protein
MIFACESNAVMGTKGPLLLALTGRTLALPPHSGDIRTCERVGTGEEVLVVYSVAVSGKPLSVARVFAASGQMLADRQFAAAGTLEFVVSGRTYRIAMPTPEWPG